VGGWLCKKSQARDEVEVKGEEGVQPGGPRGVTSAQRGKNNIKNGKGGKRGGGGGGGA